MVRLTYMEKRMRLALIHSIYKGFIIPAYFLTFGITESIIFYFGWNHSHLLKKVSFLFIGNDIYYSLYMILAVVPISFFPAGVKIFAKDPEFTTLVVIPLFMPVFYIAGYMMCMIDFSMLCLNDRTIMSPDKDYLQDFLICKGIVFLLGWAEWYSYSRWVFDGVKESYIVEKKENAVPENADN